MRPFVLFPIVLLVGCTAGKNMVVDQLEPTSPDVASESAAEAASPDASSNEMVQDATPNDAGTDAGAPPPSYKHYDINHVLSTGQSDSVANGASPYLTAQQPFGNLSFDVGVMTSKNCNGDGCKAYDTPKGFVPLVEGDKFFDYRVETMSAGFANQASLFATDWFTKTGLPVDHHDILVSLHGRSGNTYWCLRKDSCNYIPGYIQPFAEALMQVESAKTLAAAQGKSYVVRAVTAIHGGSDHYDRENELSFIDRTDGTGLVGNYAEALMEWQRDYETEVRAITGQSESIPLLVSQFGSWTDTVASRIPVRQMEAHVKAHGKVVVVTPNYPFVHYQDCLHYTNHSQRRLGAYFAKAYQRIVVEGETFEPLRPLAIQRAGNVLTVKFHVPVPPMVIDTTRVVDPGNYGFTYVDSTSSAKITKVALVGPDTVTVTLSAAPTGTAKKLRYALNAPLRNACPGPTNGARGNLRDSDETTANYTDPSETPYPLHNWAVHFELDVP